MKHIALICPAVSGHLNPMTTLGRELQRRGYRVTLVALPDAQRKAQAAGMGFAPFGEAEFAVGAVERFTQELGELDGEAAFRYTIDHYRRETRVLLRDVPQIFRRIGVEALVCDQTNPGGTVAEMLRIPFVTVCNCLAFEHEPDVPPSITPWPYDPTPEGRARNEQGYALWALLEQSILDDVNAYRREGGLTEIPVSTSQKRAGDSPLATVSQQPALFDFPRKALSPTFHYTGPFHDAASGDSIAFPFDKLDGRPLIYASMGTLQNKQQGTFRTIAHACAGLDAQLVLSLGRRDQPVPADLPGVPLVVPYAPQLELLKRAALCITHAGLNTVLESLTQGVPMVAIPVTNDQPGVAARLSYIGAGAVVPLGELCAERLGVAVERVLTEPGFREVAAAARKEIAKVDGVRRAADITQQALTTRQPVLRA